MTTTNSPDLTAPDAMTVFPDWVVALLDWLAKTALKSISDDPDPFNAAILIAISGVFAYIAGWWWLYNFMKKFNIHQLSLRIPKEYYFVYAYRTAQCYWYIIIPALAAAVIFCSSSLYFLKGWISLPLISIAIVSAALGFFYLAGCAATSFFEKMQNEKFERYPKVRVYLHKESEPEIVHLYGEELSAGRFRYLFEVDDRLLLFREVNAEPAAKGFLEVLNIRSPAVHALRFCAQVETDGDAKNRIDGPNGKGRG